MAKTKFSFFELNYITDFISDWEEELSRQLNKLGVSYPKSVKIEIIDENYLIIKFATDDEVLDVSKFNERITLCMPHSLNIILDWCNMDFDYEWVDDKYNPHDIDNYFYEPINNYVYVGFMVW